MFVYKNRFFHYLVKIYIEFGAKMKRQDMKSISTSSIMVRQTDGQTVIIVHICGTCNVSSAVVRLVVITWAVPNHLCALRLCKTKLILNLFHCYFAISDDRLSSIYVICSN